MKNSKCITRKDMWDKLQLKFTKIGQVKQTHINVLKDKYKLLKIDEGNKIEPMFKKLFVISNNLHVLRKTIP